jgi:hypothetical protein
MLGYENFCYYNLLLDHMLRYFSVCGKEPPVSRTEFWELAPAERRRVLITFFLDVGCQYAAHWSGCDLPQLIRAG